MSDTESMHSSEEEKEEVEITPFDQNKILLKLQYRFLNRFINKQYKGSLDNIKRKIFLIQDENLFNRHISRLDIIYNLILDKTLINKIKIKK